MAKRRVPRHLLPFTERFRPLAVSDLRKLPPSDQKRVLRALRDLPAGESLWVYAPGAKSKGRGAAFLAAQKNRQAEIRQARRTARLVVGDVTAPAPLDHLLIPELLPLQKKRKPRGKGKRAGRPLKVSPEVIRTLKRLGLSDVQIADEKKISRWTVSRHTK